MHACMHACASVYTYTHIYIHTHKHTHTHTHTHKSHNTKKKTGVQRLAMLLGENPVSENGRFVHQMATLKHANDQRADLIKGSSLDIQGSSSDNKGSSSDIKGSSSDIKGSSSDIKGSSSTVTPLGKRIRTNGESVDLSLNLPLDSAE